MRRVIVGAVIAAGLACGTLSVTDPGPKPLPDASDAASDAGSDATVSCDPDGTFASVRWIAELTDGGAGTSSSSPRPTEDELTVYFDSTRGGAMFDIYVATRASRSAPFGTIALVQNVDDAGTEAEPWISAQGLELFFGSDRGGKNRIWRSTRSATSVFTEPEPVALPGQKDGGSDFQPFVLESPRELWFSSDRDTVGLIGRLYRARGDDAGGFAAPELIDSGVAAADSDYFPTLSADGLTLYFARSPGANPGSHIFVAHRASIADEFAPAHLVAELAGDAGSEFPSWISRDHCRFYFTKSLPGSTQLFGLAIAERAPR
jgi:hypothetical protein